MTPRFHVGDLVLLDIGATRTSFATHEECKSDGTYFLYEKINVDSYPSYNDFFGNKIKALNGTIAPVVRVIGPPRKMITKRSMQKYCIYEILVSGSLCQIFAADLKTPDP